MFARKVAAHLRPNSLSEFKDLMEREILPWLREQEGFLGLINLAIPGGREVATISFWDHQGHAQACSTNGFPEALNTLAELLDGAPYVKTFEVVSSTFEEIALARPPDPTDLARERRRIQNGGAQRKASISRRDRSLTPDEDITDRGLSGRNCAPPLQF